MAKLTLTYDHYYTYSEIESFFDTAVAEYPTLAEKISIGKSQEGRDIWCLILTNKETGLHTDKPAIYIDGNIHAGEVTASHVCLHTIYELLHLYAQDAQIKHVLDQRTWYMIPRVNPDGAELYLNSPFMLRSVTRLNPDWEDRIDGALYPDDLDNDGLVRFMRVKDELGIFKVSEKDARLLIPRNPGDFEGDFYNLYLEGTIHNYKGGPITPAPDQWNLDMNRNFPSGWQPTQRGGGAFPLSEPEALAMVKFIQDHPNIGALQAYHTMSGAILRPSGNTPDKALPKADVMAYKELGKIGEDLTGYPCISILEGFTGDPIYGVFVDWSYEHRGLLGFSTELWDPLQQAGKTGKKNFTERSFSEEDELLKLKWNDEALNGEAFMPWTPFQHPQLGEVEIGGWHPKYFAQNPWLTRLQDECERNHAFSLKHAAALPEIMIEKLEIRAEEDQIYTITLDLANRGWLPTNVTTKALQLKMVKDITAMISGDFEIITGKDKEKLGQLDGFMFAREGWYTFGRAGYQRNMRKRVVWTVRKTKENANLVIQVQSDRAGNLNVEKKF
ncbi:MAG: M14 family metallopeptidase [Gammaproteobacteria bacterium]